MVCIVVAPALQARSASCRGPHGSAGMQGELRRGAHGTVLCCTARQGMTWARMVLGIGCARGACANKGPAGQFNKH